MSEILARAVELTRRFGPTITLDAVDLDIPAGQLVGLLGPNGAGRSTLLQLLTGGLSGGQKRRRDISGAAHSWLA